MTTPQAAFITSHGQAIPLQAVAIDACLRDLLAQVEVAQTYANHESQPIEALYTFPLPTAAILLDFEVQLGERRLVGRVVEKHAAEKSYEAAITSGNLAIMLENPQPGLYTVNLGNLLPGEVATIRFRYALLLDWRENGVRFALPTTLAPRYGDPAQAGLAPQQVPTAAADVRHPFSVNIRLEGSLAAAGVSSPSHRLATRMVDGSVAVTLQGASMDRDVIVDLQVARDQRGFAWWQPDVGGVAVVAAFQADFGLTADPAPRNVKIVVDCSGSMAGDSIQQAKEALARILDGLRPQDEFNVICYGSHAVAWFPRQVVASPANLQAAREKLREVDANLGGTETAAALQAAYQSLSRDQAAGDVLLITDGEIWQFEPVIEAARSSGHRIFTVGVGSAVSEPFVTGLASATGGACEMVTPNEAMAERIHRHFRRMYAPRARSIQIDWGCQPLWQQPQALPAAYDGDTVVIAAQLPAIPQALQVHLELADQRRLSQTIAVRAAEPATDPRTALVARVAHALYLRQLPAAAAVSEAVTYQIPCAHANVLIVDVRAEADKAPDLPVLRQVPQELAAGWGGMGSAVCAGAPATMSAPAPASAPVMRSMRAPASAPSMRAPEAPAPAQAMPFGFDMLESLGFGSEAAGISEAPLAELEIQDNWLPVEQAPEFVPPTAYDEAALTRWLEQQFAGQIAPYQVPADVFNWPLPPALLSWLHGVGATEAELTRATLVALSVVLELLRPQLSRQTRRVMLVVIGQVDSELKAAAQAALGVVAA